MGSSTASILNELRSFLIGESRCYALLIEAGNQLLKNDEILTEDRFFIYEKRRNHIIKSIELFRKKITESRQGLTYDSLSAESRATLSHLLENREILIHECTRLDDNILTAMKNLNKKLMSDVFKLEKDRLILGKFKSGSTKSTLGEGIDETL